MLIFLSLSSPLTAASSHSSLDAISVPHPAPLPLQVDLPITPLLAFFAN